MSTPGPDDPTAPSQPSAELGGLDPKDLLNAGLETVPPVTLPPRLVDSDATIAVSRPQPTQPRNEAPELPLPEELTALLPGGNYHVESFLGQGGMGAVYKGLQVRLKRPVAIKIMRRDLGKDHDFEARFEREAQAMAKLNHPNIVSVIDFGEAGPDYLYIVMELIDGADLMDVIRGGQMTQEMALSLLPQICDALQFAHDHGIVHRDIKPSNIMLTRDGRIKMADFGLAKRFDVESSFRTQTGTGMGTPDYAAPEQFSPDTPIDHRADIYALGVMIYQMITGHLPRGVWKPPSQRAKVSTQWDAVVSRAMQSDPCDRYQQASEVKTDVERVSKLVPPDAKSAPSSTNSLKAGVGGTNQEIRSTSQSRAPLLIGLVVGVIVITAIAFFALKGPDGSGRGHQTATEAPPDRALASTPTSTISIPGLPDLPPLSVPSGEPRLVKEFPLSGGLVRGLHLLPDSRRVLITQDATIKLQDLETGGTAWLIKAGMGAVASAINEDGTRVVVAYPFDAAGKALVGPGPDGGYFEVNLHEMATGKALQSWKVPCTRMSTATGQIALSPSGKMIVVRTGAIDKGPTTFVALELGKAEPVAQWKAAEHHGYTTHALSETSFISTGSVPPFQMNTADPAARMNQLTWLAEAKYSSVFSPDRRWVVASNGSSCSVWDMMTGKSHLLENSEMTFSSGVFAGNDLLLRYQSKAEIPKRIIQAWDRATGRALAEYPPSKPGFYWGNLSAGAPNGQFFVNVVAPLPTAPNKSDRILQVWSLPKPGQVHGLVKPPTSQPEPPRPALAGAATTPSTSTATIPGLPDLPPLNIPPGEPGFVKEINFPGSYLNDFKVLPDSRRMIVFQGGTVKMVDLQTAMPVWSVQVEGMTRSFGISRDGAHFAHYRMLDENGRSSDQTKAKSAVIDLRSTADGLLVQTWSLPVTKMGVSSGQLALSPSGNRLIVRVGANGSGLGSDAVCFMALEKGKTAPVGQWVLPEHNGHVTTCLDEDRYLSTGNGNAALLQISLPGKVQLFSSENAILRNAVSQDGRVLAATHQDSKLSLWDIPTRRRLFYYEDGPAQPSALAFAGDGLLIGVGDQSQTSKNGMAIADVVHPFAVWDRVSGKKLASFEPPHPDQRCVERVDAAPNGTFCVVRVKHYPVPASGETNLVQIYRLPKPGQVHGLVKPTTTSPAKAETPDAQKLVWRDALAEAPLKKVIATADHTDKGYLLPPGNHWEFPAQPVPAGAIRVVSVTEAGSPNHLSLNFGLPGTRDHYQVFFRRKLDQCSLAYLKEGLPEKRLAVKQGVHLADGQPYEFLLARIADEFYFLLNGEVILQATEPDPTARYLTLNYFGDTHTRVQKVEYLNLDGLPEAEALRILGVDEKGKDLRGKTETAK